ncbi:oligosaccharide flippase family protein [Candidatus Nomurabacteria bacterium]|uniref:Oligosaccharide flippase family protein n=1 Tax=candidate division WWE3 bacterium TaxID=2053526 RepID=A0A955IVW4_UNCKA|nr:oligosaccharide flippase family protein [candidate division WWE3 bacterium]MCB9824144.1 oligosaccharide flippase family protein [Candidatus Nomurabacteria bacterium]MCB9826885.1 oligosaccharide flippase family protein [Candidatus Nomurabacteria bacterium]MCB9828085.1 oligosaccharide flippase family protein [Candidatus Nomurabacteria bacterium]
MMLQKIGRLRDSQLLYGTVVVSAGTLLGSVFSYLLQVLLGRFLSVEDYGTFNALLSLSVIFGVPIGALVTALIKKVTELRVANRFDVLTLLFKKFSLFSLLAGFYSFLLIVVSRYTLSSYLKIDHELLVFIFGVFTCLTFIIMAPSSYLQGLLRFKAFAFFTSFSSFLRLLLALLFVVVLKTGLSGAFTGMSIAIVASYGISLLLLKKNFTSHEVKIADEHFKEVFKFAITTVFVTLGLNLLNNVDVLLVKHHFDPQDAGIYSGIVTVGKVFLFGASIITVVMYPQISQLYASGGDYMRRFRHFFVLQASVVSLGLGFFYFFSPLVIKTLFGNHFSEAAEYLPHFAIFVALYILTYFMIMFFLATDKTKVYWFLLPASFAQFVLIELFHDSLTEVINVNVFVSLALFLAVTVYFFSSGRFVYSASKQ